LLFTTRIVRNTKWRVSESYISWKL